MLTPNKFKNGRFPEKEEFDFLPALTRFESHCERKPRLKIRRAHTKKKINKKIVRKIRSGGDEDIKLHSMYGLLIIKITT